ncbi:hypothetical protein [Streptomyces sp. NPDC048641]|uniref:hypothetical protein n=1 Tax=Streptomyces sp. NPDC048641 TaxID=3154825 RepID=UPI00342F23AF
MSRPIASVSAVVSWICPARTTGDAVVAEHPGAVVARQFGGCAPELSECRASHERGCGRGAQAACEVVADHAGVLDVRPHLDAGGVVLGELGVRCDDLGEQGVAGFEVAALQGLMCVEGGLLGVDDAAQVRGEPGALAQPPPGRARLLAVVARGADLAAVPGGDHPGQVEPLSEGVAAARGLGLREVAHDRVHAVPRALHLVPQPHLGDDGVGAALPGGVVRVGGEDGVDQLLLLRGGDVCAVGVENPQVGEEAEGALRAFAAGDGGVAPGGAPAAVRGVEATLQPGGPHDALRHPGEVLVVLVEVQEGAAVLDVVEDAEKALADLLEAHPREGVAGFGLGGGPGLLLHEAGPAAQHPGRAAGVFRDVLVREHEPGAVEYVGEPGRVGVVLVAALLERGEEEGGRHHLAVPLRHPCVDGPPQQRDAAVLSGGVVARARPLEQQAPEPVEVVRQEPVRCPGSGEQGVQLGFGGGGLGVVLPGGPDEDTDEGGADLGLPRPLRCSFVTPPGFEEGGPELPSGFFEFLPVAGGAAVQHEGGGEAVPHERQVAGGQRGVEDEAVVRGGGRGVCDAVVGQRPLQVQVAAALVQVDGFFAAVVEDRGGLLVQPDRLVEDVEALRVRGAGGEIAGLGVQGEEVAPEGAYGVVRVRGVRETGHARPEQLRYLIEEFGRRLGVVLKGTHMRVQDAPRRPHVLLAG